MQVTISTLSDAVASAEAHQAYGIAQGLVGNKRLARKHQRHADAIMREVMELTKPDIEMSDDELLSELMAE